MWLDVECSTGQRRVPGQVETGHLLLADLGAGLIFLLDTDRTHLQAGPGLRGLDAVEHGLPAVERPAGSVAADGAEEAVLDGVPLVTRKGAFHLRAPLG